MPEAYSFRILREDLSKRRLQGRAMHVMLSLFMLFYGLQFVLKGDINWWQLLAVVPPAILIPLLVIFRRRLFDEPENNRLFRILEAGFLLMGSMHFLQRDLVGVSVLYFLVCVFAVLLLWLESRLFGRQVVRIAAEGIQADGPLRIVNIPWASVERVTLKNHYLTLHLKQGPAKQWRVDDRFLAGNEDAFLQFCEACR